MKVISYIGTDKQEEIAIECTVLDCLKWGGYGVCDLCNESRLLDTGDPDAQNDRMYLCPELGSKALCEKCFKEHKERVKWYHEDFPFIEDTLKLYTSHYLPSMADEEIAKIKEFIEKKRAQ